MVGLDMFLTNLVPATWQTFLNTQIYAGSLIYWNYWTIMHIITGLAAYYIWPRKFKTFFYMVLAFEAMEYVLGINQSPLFYEEATDIVWDFIATLGGFWLARGINIKKWNIKGL